MNNGNRQQPLIAAGQNAGIAMIPELANERVENDGDGDGNGGAIGGLVHMAQPPIGQIAEPLHVQRLEAALNMRPFMSAAREILAQPMSSGEDNDDDKDLSELDSAGGAGLVDLDDPNDMTIGIVSKKSRKQSRLFGTKEERQSVKTQIYNFSDLTTDREWIYDVLLSDTDSDSSDYTDEDDYIKEILKVHVREQKHRENFYKKPANIQYAYYGAGILSNQDMFSEHQQSIVGVRKRRRRTKKELLMVKHQQKTPKLPKQRKQRRPNIVDSPESGEINPADLKHYYFADTLPTSSHDNQDDEDDDNNKSVDELDDDELNSNDDIDVGGGSENNDLASGSVGAPGSGRRRANKRSQQRTPEVMAARRRRIWQQMAKKEIGRCQRSKQNNHKEMVQNCKRVAGMCMKVVRQKAIQSQRLMKETVWRAKRMTREMLSYWKRYERVERDHRKRMEKEAEEQRKQDVEIIEAKRQQRKLNFLITQTELYAHFMSKKLGQGKEEDQLRILNQLDEEVNPRLAEYDDYNASEMKQLAQQNAEEALNADQAKAKQFMMSIKKENDATPSDTEGANEVKAESDPEAKEPVKADLPQPKLFKGTLKTYQLKGMTWLANIYDQGISGILADEMGLGKTVQSIAFLCHIAERYGVWGPFLVISPASTLHNWQQEMERFVPDFNVVPYWGSPNERKILRQFWEQKDLHTKEASFHVVITSYQLIVSDYKYFNRIKWQYMVLDEAQAIKSSASQRWKLLLGFNCRNRLLLSGTPIQNSMAELWALLHFIMPTLFDSHDEFNEWFSKDIESHAENKTGIDEKQISRLHMILKPFMLRRIKKDVENELSDKIEIMVYCPLTIRQKLLYMALKQKIRIEDLLHLTTGASSAATASMCTSNLMNLVMQFRKVCNHPELFERRDAKSPFSMRCEEYVIPRLVFDDGLLHRALPSKRHLLYNKFAVFKAAHVQFSLKSLYEDVSEQESCFSFTRFCDLAPKDVEDCSINGLITFLSHYRQQLVFFALLAYRRQWWPHYQATRFQLIEPMLEQKLHTHYMFKTSLLNKFIFTAMTSTESSVYAFGDYKMSNMQESIEHRVIRSKNIQQQAKANSSEEFDVENIKEEPDLESVEVQTVGQKSKHKSESKVTTLQLLPEFPYKPRKPDLYKCEPLAMPRFLYGLGQRVQAIKRHLYCESRAAAWAQIRHYECENIIGRSLVDSGLELCKPRYGWSSIIVPDKETLISDAGKLAVLDSLLTRLKADGHRVLIYSQMTKMIDLLEEYMWHRKHRYMRLDGSSKISERRDMVADFQTRADIFVFLLSTRAGGLGINLTAADTRILVNDEFHVKGGPLFIYIGGEWKIGPDDITSGLWHDIAHEHNGSLIYTEHRFFGESVPTTEYTTENLQNQHVKQSLADLAHVIDTLRSEEKYNNSKVVISGCSYSATMTVLFRQLYPNHTVGGWASSAPLEARVDFKDFMEVVGRVYLELGSQACYDRLENATAFYEDLFATGQAEEAKKRLNICEGFDENNEHDIWTLFGSFSGSAANLVQKQKPGDVVRYCTVLLGLDNDDAAAFAEWMKWIMGYPKCINARYQSTVNYYKWTMAHPDGGSLAWIYQTCKEFGWYQSSGSDNQPFGSNFPVQHNLNLCKDVFGENFSAFDIDLNVALTNNEFGGKNAAVNNTYQTHGGLDAWHLAGAGIEQGAIIIPQASHCPDQESISDSDSHELRKSKRRLVRLVRKWLV